jgi:hypothetical protein
MDDELSFEHNGFARIGEHFYQPRPAVAAVTGGRSAADYDREQSEHLAKAAEEKRREQECKNAAAVDLLAAGVLPEAAPALVPLAGIEAYSATLHEQEAEREKTLAAEAQKRAEQARRDEEVIKQQASPFVHPTHDGDTKPHDVTREGGVLPADGRLDPDHPSFRGGLA